MKSWLVTIVDGEVRAVDPDNEGAAEAVKDALASGDTASVRVERVTAAELLKLVEERDALTLS